MPNQSWAQIQAQRRRQDAKAHSKPDIKIRKPKKAKQDHLAERLAKQNHPVITIHWTIFLAQTCAILHRTTRLMAEESLWVSVIAVLCIILRAVGTRSSLEKRRSSLLSLGRFTRRVLYGLPTFLEALLHSSEWRTDNGQVLCQFKRHWFWISVASAIVLCTFGPYIYAFLFVRMTVNTVSKNPEIGNHGVPTVITITVSDQTNRTEANKASLDDLGRDENRITTGRAPRNYSALGRSRTSRAKQTPIKENSAQRGQEKHLMDKESQPTALEKHMSWLEFANETAGRCILLFFLLPPLIGNTGADGEWALDTGRFVLPTVILGVSQAILSLSKSFEKSTKNYKIFHILAAIITHPTFTTTLAFTCFWQPDDAISIMGTIIKGELTIEHLTKLHIAPKATGYVVLACFIHFCYKADIHFTRQNQAKA